MRGALWCWKKKNTFRFYPKRVLGGLRIAIPVLITLLYFCILGGLFLKNIIYTTFDIKLPLKVLPAIVIWIFLVGWLLLDVLIPRKSIYALLGFREAVISSLLRSLRSSLVASLPLAILAYTLLTVSAPVEYNFSDRVEAATIAVSAAIAIFGVFYSSFVSTQNSRNEQTVNLLQQVRYNETMPNPEIDLAKKRKQVAYRLGKNDIDEIPHTYITGTLRYDIVMRLNLLEFLVLAIRIGEARYNITPLLMSARFIKETTLYRQHIRKSTKAKRYLRYDGKRIWVAQNKTYEHLLWLVMQIHHRRGDAIDPMIVHPQIVDLSLRSFRRV